MSPALPLGFGGGREHWVLSPNGAQAYEATATESRVNTGLSGDLPEICKVCKEGTWADRYCLHQVISHLSPRAGSLLYKHHLRGHHQQVGSN